MQAMARASYCDARATLDLYRKPEEKRVPLKSWGNICQVSKDRRQQPDEEEEMKIRRKPEMERRKQRRRLGICGGIDDVTAEIVETVKICWSQAELSDGEEQLSRLRGVSLAPVPRPLLRALEEAMVTLGLSYEREYSWDIFSAMMRKQSSCAFKSSELPRGFTNYMRAILVDWLIQVHESFRCTEETLYLCVHLLNSSMRLSKVNIPTFQLLGMTCLFVACKKEECLFPESTELCFLMENCFTRKQLLRMERKVLTCLKFDLSYSQPLHFLYIVHTVSQCSQQVLHLAKYFLELTLLDIECIVCEPAQLAAAALCLARRVLQERSSPEAEEAWTRAVSLYSVSESALCRIKRCMARAALRAENSETQATFMKYSIPERMEVSSNSTVLCSRYLLDCV
ncbi:cyclin-P-like isoform X1 [Acipenser ruthenus]|uniref:cyclin-P-like isoform X1 n=1 Tax=Acipenser ruthenus TaxID=7906 RepID=UPI00145B36C7|nr:cyclin-P-like isoform X1 [Acipenser ruthenus]